MQTYRSLHTLSVATRLVLFTACLSLPLTGFGVGAWSGAKHVPVEGTLWENGKIKGTFTAMRYSGGGAFGGYKGTCAILGRCVKAIGKDGGGWLRAASMKAHA